MIKQFLFFLLLFLFQFNNYLVSDWLLYKSETGSNINSVKVSSNNRVWVGGNSNYLRYSDDNGLNWNTILLGKNFDIKSIFLSNDNVYVAGSNKTFYHSPDKGITWLNKSQNIDLPHNTTITSVYFSNDNRGWVATNTGRIFRTEDRGNTFTEPWTDTSAISINNIFFKDNNTGYAVGNNLLLRTGNGGNSWHFTTLDVNEKNYTDIISIEETIILTTNSNKIYLSSNNFQSYDTKIFSDITSISSASALDRNNIIIAGNNGKVYKTENNFFTYAKYHAPTNLNILDIYFKNKDEIWAVGQGGLKTYYKKGFSLYDYKPDIPYPIAITGKDIFTTKDTYVHLNRRESLDYDVYRLRYNWRQVEGPTIPEIFNADRFFPHFFLSEYGTYKLEMTITNVYGQTDKDILTIFALPDTPVYNLYSNENESITIDTGLIYDTFIRLINIKTATVKEINIPVYNKNTNSFNDTFTIKFNPAEKDLKLIVYKINEDLKKGIPYLSKFDSYKHTIIGLRIYDKNDNYRSKTIDTLRYGFNYEITYSFDSNLYQREKNNLGVFAFDEIRQLWLPLSSEVINNSIKADTHYLFTFGMFEKAPVFENKSNLSDIIIYPNPYKPNDGIDATGIEYNGLPGTGIYFSGLMENTHITIVDLSGKKIYSGKSTLPGHYQWTGKDNGSRNVQSGLYIVNFRNNNESSIKKIMIIR